jgi:nucleoid DNA-binding protein
MAERLNTQDLGKALAANTTSDLPELNNTQAVELVKLVFDLVEETVVEGNQVAITGFGKFEKYERQNGAMKPKFTPFTDFKTAVSG